LNTNCQFASVLLTKPCIIEGTNLAAWLCHHFVFDSLITPEAPTRSFLAQDISPWKLVSLKANERLLK